MTKGMWLGLETVAIVLVGIAIAGAAWVSARNPTPVLSIPGHSTGESPADSAANTSCSLATTVITAAEDPGKLLLCCWTDPKHTTSPLNESTGTCAVSLSTIDCAELEHILNLTKCEGFVESPADAFAVDPNPLRREVLAQVVRKLQMMTVDQLQVALAYEKTQIRELEAELQLSNTWQALESLTRTHPNTDAGKTASAILSREKLRTQPESTDSGL